MTAILDFDRESADMGVSLALFSAREGMREGMQISVQPAPRLI